MSAFTPTETRAINILGWGLGMTGPDPIKAIVASDQSIEGIVAECERFGYSPQTGEKFAFAVLESGVLFSDVPPAADEEDEEDEVIPGLTTDSPNFGDTLDNL